MLKKLLLFILPLAVLAAGCSDPKTLMEKGSKAHVSGEYGLAIYYFNKILEKDPANVDALINRGMAYEASMERKRAQDDYLSAIQADSQSVPAYNNLGALMLDAGRYAEAFVYLNKAIKINPHYARAYLNRGAVYLKQNSFDQALADFNMAISLDASSALGYYNRAMAYAGLKNYGSAISDFNKSLELKPNSRMAYMSRARMRIASGDYSGAVQDFTALINKGGQNMGMAYFYRAQCYYALHNSDLALADLKQTVNLLPTYGPAYELLGDIFAPTSRENAERHYIMAKKVDPANAARYDERIKSLATGIIIH